MFVVPDELLLEIYKKSLKNDFSVDFILTLEKEIKKRKLPLPND